MNALAIAAPQQNIVVGENVPQLPTWRVDKGTGEFIHTFGIKLATIEVVVLGVQMTRMLWPSDYEEGNQPLCGSYDMQFPYDRNTEYGTGEEGFKACQGCALSQWSSDKGKRIKPPCAEVYNALIVDVANNAPGIMSFMRTRSDTGRNLASFWRFMGKKKTVTFTSNKVTGKRGEWFGVNFQIANDITPELRSDMMEFMSFLNMNFAQSTSEVDEEHA